MSAVVPLSIETLRERYASNEFSPREMVETVLERLDQRGNDSIWIHKLTCEDLLHHIRQIEAWKSEGRALPRVRCERVFYRTHL